MSDAHALAAGLGTLGELATRIAARSDELTPIVAAMRRCLADGGTLFFAGNGGSAADAQHIATEYVVRYDADQLRGVRALALTTDSSALTAAGNDFGFEEIFARQLAALARPGDLLMVHSTSGESANLIRAVSEAGQRGVVTVALLGGHGGRLRDLVDHAFVVEDAAVNHVQEIHLAIEHQIAALLTAEFGR
jgi:D-sedoheptulose 7-phosphate isomerase